MEIISINAKNFKSFNPSGIEFRCDSGLNIIVGENNVGKSNICKILQDLIQLLESPNKFNPTHAYHANIDNEVELKVEINLNDDDIKFLMHQFSVLPQFQDDFVEIFGNNLKITYRFNRFRGSKIFIRFGDMNIFENHGSYENLEEAKSGGYHPQHWQPIINTASENNESLTLAVSTALRERPGFNSNLLEFPTSPREIFARLFIEKIVIFPEFRERPSAEQTPGVFSSPKGRGAAYVLFNLKNGDLKQRKRFKTIQEHFSEIFPNLLLDVRQGHQIVVVKSDNHEIDQDSIGAGIVEIIILLIHLIEIKNHIFVLDEPELHLHPHAKRSVSDLIKKAEKNNQILCITHSTHFVYPEKLHRVTLVKDVKGSSRLIRLSKDYFSQDELKKILKFTTTQQKEFFFARAVLIVEGETESGSIPILAKKIDQDLNLHNVSVISAESHHFSLFVKILRGYKIPYMIMLDFDTLSNIEESIEIESKKVKTSSLIKQLNDLQELTREDLDLVQKCEKGISDKEGHSKYDKNTVEQLLSIIKKHKFIYLLPTDYEGLFKNSNYNEIITNAKREFKRNKVLQGKFIAENINEVPLDLVEVIDKTVFLTQ